MKKVKKKNKKKPGKKSLKKIKKTVRKKPQKRLEKPKEKEIGVITHYFGKISVGIIKLKAGLKVGDKIHIKGAHDDFAQVVQSMQINHKDVPYAQKGAEVGIIVTQRVHENDKVYKIPGEGSSLPG